MIEKIIDWSTKNRFIVLTVYFLLTGYGIYTAINLKVDAIPDLSENQVIIYTEWMGRSPQIIEDQITFPISSALQGLTNVKAVRASSMFGMSFVFVIFNENTDIYFARSRVSERLNTIQSQLPQGVTPTLGPDGTGVGHIYWYTVEGEGYNLAELRSIQDWFIRYKLSSVDGVAEVASIGGFVKQYQIDINPYKLRAFNLSINDVINAVQRNNNEVGGKLLELNSAEYFIRGQGYINSVTDINNILVKADGSVPIKIENVASVQLGADIRRGSLDKDGKGETVGGVVILRNGENARDVIVKVKEKIKEIQIGLPKGVSINTSYDRSTLIDAAVATLENALLEAALTVSLMIAIFLLHFRSILRIIIEIPIAVLLSFILMDLFNITSNIMSLGGIILAIGVIVDSSIVMVENAHRLVTRALSEKGHLKKEDYIIISVQAAKQVGRAIFFSELIILVSFLPVFLLSGQEGKLFTPLAFTKTFVMTASAAISITLIPVLMTLLTRGKFLPEEKNPVTNFFNRIYKPAINFALKYRKTVLSLNVIALLIAIPMVINTGSEFMPPLDEGSILFMPVTLPNASITEVNRIMQQQDKIIKSIPEVEHVLGKAGRAETATDNAPLSMIETIIILKPKSEWRKGITKNEIIQELDAKLQIPGVRNGWTQPIINRINMLATGVRTDIGFKIFGSNLDTLEYYATKAEGLLKKVDGAADVVAERFQLGYYLDIKIKKDAAARYGLSITDINDVIEFAVGGQNLGSVIEGRMRYPIRVRFSKDFRDDVDNLKNLIIPIPFNSSNNSISSMNKMEFKSTSISGMNSMNNKNNSIAENSSITTSLSESEDRNYIYLPLSSVADVEVNIGPPMISSENGMLRSVVFMNARGKDLGSVINDSKKMIDEKLKLPPGYFYTWSGQYENKIRAQNTLMIIMPVVFFIIFVLLYLTFKDFKEAAVVMLSVPFALIGGMYLIYILGYNFSVAVWVGFIALYGIAVETGVVMVVYLHEALDRKIRDYKSGKRGEITVKDIYDATVEGSTLRLRPKLMTVFTSMIGLIPVMWATGTGSDVMKPLTAPLVGGLLTSAVHVLVVTPILFIIMKERALKKGVLTESKISSWMKESEYE